MSKKPLLFWATAILHLKTMCLTVIRTVFIWKEVANLQ